MNGQQLQLPIYRQIAGTVQVPLVMLIWGALVLFFGHQYQANALLPSGDQITDVGSLQANDLLRAQQRNDRLLAELAAQAPAKLPDLLDSRAFELDLATVLAATELGQGAWHPGQDGAAAKTEVVQALEQRTVSSLSPTTKALPLSASKPVVPSAPKVSSQELKAPVSRTSGKAAKFVRLPAVVQTKVAMRVDTLRSSKDSARAELMAGRTGIAYQRLRGQIAKGRTDIEFLGLLALASLQQQPDEAEVIYRHLMQLQPDAQRWTQGLEHAQRLLAANVKIKAKTKAESVLIDAGANTETRLAG